MLRKNKRIFVVGADTLLGEKFLGKLIQSKWTAFSLEKSSHTSVPSFNSQTFMNDLPSKLNFDKLDAIVSFQAFANLKTGTVDSFEKRLKRNAQLSHLASKVLIKSGLLVYAGCHASREELKLEPKTQEEIDKRNLYNYIDQVYAFGELVDENPLPKDTLSLGLVSKTELSENQADFVAQKILEWAEGYYLPMGGVNVTPSFKDNNFYFEGC